MITDNEFVRVEVLKQLIQSSFSLLLFISAWGILFWLSHKSLKWLLDGTLKSRLKMLGLAFAKDSEYDWVGSIDVAKKGLIVAIAFVAGYFLSNLVNQEYISGNISLIVTVARVTNFYVLVVSVFNMILLSFQMLFKFLAMNFNERGAKVMTILHDALGIIGFIVTVVLSIASVVICYVNLV